MSISQTKLETLALFSSATEQLEAALANLSAADLDLSAEPGGWTIRQMVHHISEDSDAWSMPLKKAIATPGNPIRFEGFPGNDAWAAALDFDQRDIGHQAKTRDIIFQS